VEAEGSLGTSSAASANGRLGGRRNRESAGGKESFFAREKERESWEEWGILCVDDEERGMGLPAPAVHSLLRGP
jgi:hypothetical protein